MTIQATADERIASASASTDTGAFAVSVFTSLDAVEPAWRELETRALLTPYQRFDWIQAYCQSGFPMPERVAILTLWDGGRAVAMLPFGIGRRMGVRIAQIIGMPISNSDALIYDPAYRDRLTPAVIRSAFAALGKEGSGVDIISLHCLSPDWQGHANPLMGLPHSPAPNNLYLRTFKADGGAFIDEALPHKRRTNIRRSQRRLTENYGQLEVRAAETVEEIDRFHAAFLEQRSVRFREMGVENIFAQPQFQTLFRSLAIHSLGAERPAFRYHALLGGDEILATSLGVCTPTHYSQYINSTSTGPASKYSLMGVMLTSLVEELRADGILSFDMGLGDFDYKSDWTDPVIVYDSIVPVSARGAVAAPAIRGLRGVKRLIKQTPALWNAARSVMAFRTRLKQKND